MKLILVLLLCSPLSTIAESQYITGVQKVTFRTGPGTDNKIIKMLESDTKVSILETLDRWSKVKDSDGNEGYVLTQFLTKSTPYIYRFNWLKSKFDKEVEKNKKLSDDFSEAKTELKETKSELTKTQKELEEINKAYEELKEGSADFLTLKANYDKAKVELSKNNEKLKILEDELSNHNIQWFLAGGGVLLLGWLIGLISRKKKHSSGLQF